MSGVIYERWGKRDCTSQATKIYEGFMAGAGHNEQGGVNYLCLPLYDPVYLYTEAMPGGEYSLFYSTEYQTFNRVFEDTHDHNAPCVVCQALDGRTSKLVMPGSPECPSHEWNLEYYGYLMSDADFHSSKEVICVDGHPDIVPGTGDNTNGGLLYHAVVDCHKTFMPCPPYKDRVPLTCAVCTM